MSIELNGASEDTPVIDYTPDFIDEYMVIVNSPEDWETVHNYIIAILKRFIPVSNTHLTLPTKAKD